MCGRYAAGTDLDRLAEEFDVVQDLTGGLEPDWNVAPTKEAAVVVQRVRREDRERAEEQGGGPPPEPVRQLRRLVWGLVPSWSRDRSGGARMINARDDSLLTKPAFRRAAASRRALVPADGWYEWQKSPTATDGRGRPRKQPFLMTRRDGDRVALAGVYEFWKDPAAEPDDPAAWLSTFAVVTTAAEPGLDRIHDRMPLVLEREAWAGWLDPAVTDPAAVGRMLVPPAAGRFVCVPVPTLVNDARSNGPELVQPLPVDELVGVVDPLSGELLGDRQESLDV
jgi:putative SOS response-associated peptidase YedK